MKHLISIPSNTLPHFHQISGLSTTDWFVSSDPKEKRVGSGGGTAFLLTELFSKESEISFGNWLTREKRVIIHAGGQSRRLPAYAPIGKSLLPMPVFRWSRGQHLNQRLIHLQTPLFDRILQNAPENINTLIASGDTLIFSGKNLPEIPDADVVCFGLWLEPEKATNHGVFFANHDNPGQMQFMLQKPSIAKIKELVHEYYFLMDIGIWLLSPKAVDLLMQRCGWDGESYANGIPDFYDMYSEFGIAMGQTPVKADEDINKLSVALVNLEGGEFYHLGNTSELITSNLSIQNRITDQREIWHRQIKPHPSIFVLNTEIKCKLEAGHNNLWIENSFIPDSWTLKCNHALTNIPENKWTLKLNAGDCIDFIPTGNDHFIIRNYGFDDPFRGKLEDDSTQFMGTQLTSWINFHHLNEAFKNIDPATDIQFIPLFANLSKEQITSGFLQWLVDKNPEANKDYQNLWIESNRFSADEISQQCDIAEINNQSNRFRKQAIPAIAQNFANSVFYQLDLDKLADEFVKNKLELPAEHTIKSNDWLPIHAHMFRSAVKRKQAVDFKNEETKAFEYLRDTVLAQFHSNTVDPSINLLPDQIAWGRSPVRLDLAGGWSDTPPYCFLYGGKVLNLAVELNGQPPLHCYIKATSDPHFVLRSIDLGAQEIISTFDELREFYSVGSPFAITKAALALSGFLPEFSHRKFATLEKQLSELGGGLEISILSAVPKGSGLGTSSILAATVLGTLSEVCNLHWDKIEIGRRTLALEQLLTTGGGWQDQFGGIMEGVKILETAPGKTQRPLVKWVPDSLFTDPVFKNRILLYYTGITRIAKNILADIVRGMFLNSSEHLAILDEIKNHADYTGSTLSSKDFEKLAKNINRSWELNQQLDKGTNTPEIQQLIDRIKPWSIGHKLLGAGGGGFMLIFAESENAATQIKHELISNPVNPRARFVDFQISQSGLQVTKS